MRREEQLNIEKGQHLLVDEGVMSRVVEHVPENCQIFEVGAGSGLLTRELLRKSGSVVGVEIDDRFKDDLCKLEKDSEGLEIIFDNVLEVLNEKKMREMGMDFDKLWVVGNIPYHITEPLIMRLASLPIKGATLLTGARFANEISLKSGSDRFGKLTLLVNTFFSVNVVDFVDKGSFRPPPRTSSAIVVFERRLEDEYGENMDLFLLRDLFLSAKRGTLVKNQMRRSLIDYHDKHDRPLTKNEARKIIAGFNLEKSLLDKSIEQLNNKELGDLSKVLIMPMF